MTPAQAAFEQAVKAYDFQKHGGPLFFEQTLGRIVKSARSGKRNKTYRWCVVSNLTMHGSGWSIDLCKYFGVDPYERV